MRSALLFAAVFVSGAVSGRFLDAASARNKVAVDLPMSERQSRPKITLKTALKIAEDYITSEHIDVSKGWMSEARFILYGDKTNPGIEKEPCWFFVWQNGGSRGNHSVNIGVFMNGKPMQFPSM
jgi:hypothetical protein